jgi:hypothetical protein
MALRLVALTAYRVMNPSKPSGFPYLSSTSEPHSPPQALAYEGEYSCPICGHGKLSALLLTEAFACDFCRHIFSANLSEQSVQVLDSPQPLAWRWRGGRWYSLTHADPTLDIIVWTFFAALTIFPAGLVALSAYLFPPMQTGGGSGYSFSWIWAAATFVIHLLMALRFVTEHYQWPWYVTCKVTLQNWRYR